MDEEVIVQRCRKGDLTAYRLLYDRYSHTFLRTALRMLSRQQDAEDAVQETFLKLHRGIHHYRSGSKLSSYMFRILLNCCYDILRKRGKESTGDPELAGLSSHPTSELRFSIEQAIAALPAKMRACFILFAVEGLKLEEIAQVMETSAGGVKANIHRARAKLRDWLSASRQEVPT